MAATLLTLVLLYICNLRTLIFASAELIFEDGYTVTTVLDGHKLKVNPHLVALRSGSHDLVLLDSANSAFYTLSLPLSQVSVMKKLSGKGESGFSDGDLGSAMFGRPRSFAVDSRGNVYVADRSNGAVRKISASGVTTIAGGQPGKIGHADGPGKTATFSPDFELTFVPDICALLVSDHGNQLIRQINLKPKDCARGSHSGVGATGIWVLALGVSCLVGIIIGFLVRPCINRHVSRISETHYLMFNNTLGPLISFLRKFCRQENSSKAWSHYLMNLERQAQMFCFDIRSAVAKSPLFSISGRFVSLSLSQLSLQLSLMFRISQGRHKVVCREYVSLLDSDMVNSPENVSSKKYVDQLKDLISFDGSPASSISDNVMKLENEKEGAAAGSDGRVDDMIQANVTGFVEDARKMNFWDSSLLGNSTLVKRK